ncbi:hypothetical protein SNEBB_002433 [Seison nebaliae]|nr:hypothetical protein SNEBB_002433 [Seison nebaliae]
MSDDDKNKMKIESASIDMKETFDENEIKEVMNVGDKLFDDELPFDLFIGKKKDIALPNNIEIEECSNHNVYCRDQSDKDNTFQTIFNENYLRKLNEIVDDSKKKEKAKIEMEKSLPSITMDDMLENEQYIRIIRVERSQRNKSINQYQRNKFWEETVDSPLKNDLQTKKYRFSYQEEREKHFNSFYRNNQFFSK